MDFWYMKCCRNIPDNKEIWILANKRLSNFWLVSLKLKSIFAYLLFYERTTPSYHPLDVLLYKQL